MPMNTSGLCKTQCSFARAPGGCHITHSLLGDNVRNPAARAKALSWERTWNAWCEISVGRCGIFTSLQTKIVASPIELQPRIEILVCHCRACCFPRTEFTELICSCLNISASRNSHLNKAVRILHKKQRLAFSPRNFWGSGSKLRPRKPRILGTFRGAMHRR